MKLAIMCTACRRPYYLSETLGSWALARGVEDVPFTIALGNGGRHHVMCDVIDGYRDRLDLTIVSDRVPGAGLHTAIADGIDYVFAEGADFVVASEEDVVVSDDVLEYFAWASDALVQANTVLAVCAHSRGGQGWDKHEPAQDADADQSLIRLEPYFNAWCWGTWRDRWENVLRPSWDWDCTSGGASDSGYDWNIATRVIPSGGFLCAVPDASRSQNIGRLEGWASSDWSFSFSQAQSFREHRPAGPGRMVG